MPLNPSSINRNELLWSDRESPKWYDPCLREESFDVDHAESRPTANLRAKE